MKKGQIAHLDGNWANNAEDNLAFLCFDHHDEYDSKTSQSKGLTEQEVKAYRKQLYQEVVYLVLETNTPSAQVTPQTAEWKKIIREISYCLHHYAKWYGQLGSGQLDDMKKAYEALQECASRLVASVDAQDCPIDPSSVEEAKALLIGISNTLIDGDILYMQQNPGYVPAPAESQARRKQSRENRQHAESIKRLLGLSQ